MLRLYPSGTLESGVVCWDPSFSNFLEVLVEVWVGRPGSGTRDAGNWDLDSGAWGNRGGQEMFITLHPKGFCRTGRPESPPAFRVWAYAKGLVVWFL